MTVNELQEILQQAINNGLGELLVVVEADHGQTPMHTSWVGEDAVEDTGEYIMERVEEGEGEPVFLIQGY